MSQNSILPVISGKKDYKNVYADNSVWLPAMQTICAKHKLDVNDLHREALGTHIVFRTGQVILKLFSTLWSNDFIAERYALSHIKGLPVPEIVAEGELEGYPYLVMTVVPGIPAVNVWKRLDTGVQIHVIRQLGEIMRQLHEHKPVKRLANDWNAFIRDRINRVFEHHAVDETWNAWLQDCISGFYEPPFEPVLLNGDLTADHILISEQAGKWRITGIVDFGDARMGHPYYEFVAPFAFFTFGEPALTKTLVKSYGIVPDAQVARRLTIYCLLHEFGRIKDFLERSPVKDGQAFYRALWGDLK